MKKYIRIVEKKLPIGRVKRTSLSGYKYFSERFSIMFRSPDYSTALAHFNNHDKSILDIHGVLPNNLTLEAIPGRWLKLPPHNLTFITGPVIVIYGKMKPFDLINELETNPSLSNIKDNILPYLVIHNEKLLSLADLVNYQFIMNNLKNKNKENFNDLLKLINHLQNVDSTCLFLNYTTFFQQIIFLLKTKIITYATPIQLDTETDEKKRNIIMFLEH